MKTYDNIDIALIYKRCTNTVQVLRATQIFKELYDDMVDIDISQVREFSNERIRQFVKNE